MRLFLLIATVNIFGHSFFNHFNSLCNVCNHKPWFWLPRGHYSTVLEIYQVIGAGFRFANKNVKGSVEIHKIENRSQKNLGTYGFNRGEFYKVLEQGHYEFIVKAVNRSQESFEISVESGRVISNGNYYNFSN